MKKHPKSMPVPEGKLYREFNGQMLHFYSNSELMEKYAMPLMK